MSSSGRPVAVIVHISGRYRGKIQRLEGDRQTIATGDDADIRFSSDDLTPGLSRLPAFGAYATLVREGDTFELQAPLDADVWINGRRAEKRRLASGDVLEIGEGGPVLRFRLYPPGSRGYKSVAEVFSDCAECIRHGRGAADRAGMAIAGPPMELLTRTSPWVRFVVAFVFVALAVSIGHLWLRSRQLEHRLQKETTAVEGLAELLNRGEDLLLSEEEVERLRTELSESRVRIEALEHRSGARARVISASAASIVFLQGGWGFEDVEGRPLRLVVGPDGGPLLGPFGPAVTLEGDGEPVEVLYSGTAFVVSDDGYLLTNRHVALPWDYDAPPALLALPGLTPVMRRFIGYMPGVVEPFDVALVRASDELDVALLRCEPVTTSVPALELTDASPSLGDEVIVLGYPAGIPALLARAAPEVVREIFEAQAMDFWKVARRLSEEGMIQPLATAGVVGQVSDSSVVYDADTTHGGSGGPVLSLDGRVLAVNAAIMEDFGGSNIGVPAAEGLRLLAHVHNRPGLTR